MRINAIRVWQVVVPMKNGTVNSPEARFNDCGLRTFGQVPKFVIRLECEDGLTGLGETPRGINEDDLVGCAEAVRGRDARRMCLWNLPLPQNGAYAAFEMALFDLVGKECGMSAAELLGGRVRNRVAVDWWAGRCKPEDLARRARAGQQAGFRGIKIKCKLEDPLVESIRAVQEACGPGFAVTVDPNGRFYEPEHAVRIARELAGCPIAVFEDPVPGGDMRLYAGLRARLPFPLARHVYSAKEIVQVIEHHAVDELNLSPPSGMAEFVREAYLAEAAGIPVWHGSGVELGIQDMSAVQACAAAPACTLPSDIVGNLFREDDLILRGIPFERGEAIVPTDPGLGVELDEAAVKHYAVEEKSL
ncbi:MAG: mandelate racemase/muconate lactonizing enzyme family protein [Planctomycetes bacterium]|nr:mandelate racemase/muconate lactonizing enzyme family protein [Planctomycetota bacterium]